MQKRKINWGYLGFIISIVIMGTIGCIRRYIDLASAPLAFFRAVGGAACIFIYILINRKIKWQKIDKKTWFLLIASGASIGINWMLLFESYNWTSIAKSTLSYYFAPTIVMVLSPFIFKEKLGIKKMACVVFSLLGMVLVSGVLQEGIAGGDIKGVALGLSAAIFYAAAIILNKFIIGLNPYQKVMLQLVFAGIALFPYILFTGGFNGINLDGRSIILLIFVCIVNTGLAYTLFFGGMEKLPAQSISLLSYIDPIVAMLLSAALFGEKLTIIAIIGAVLILGSALVCEIDSPKASEEQG